MLANTPDIAGRDLCFGTVDSWVAWVLSEGAVHVTDHSNAAVTGLFEHDGSGWNHRVCELLGIPVSILPSIVDSSGLIGSASALPGAPPIAAIAGDQQASLVGQGCVHPGLAKITFGTGGMLDLCTGGAAPELGEPHQQRHVPDRGVVTRRRAHVGRRGGHADRRDVCRMAT